jgi:DNA-binding HxlR family transcriptional regulator
MTKLSFPDPPLDWVPQLARGLQHERALDRAVLETLLAHPATFGDLKPLLRGKGDNNLTQALRRLRRDGLIRTRSNMASDPRVDHHEATELGVAVFAALVREDTLAELAKTLHERHAVPAP